MSKPAAKVMIVEDDAELASVLGDVLRGAGFETATAHHGGRALELLAGGGYDAIVLDLKMPVVDGVEFLARRAVTPVVAAVPVVVLSAWADGFEDAGVARCLMKPVTIDVLIESVRAACARRARRSEVA